LSEEEQDASPFDTFPSDVRLDEQEIRDQRTETAQGREKSELANLFAKIKPQFHCTEICLPVLLGKRAFRRKTRQAEHDHEDGNNQRADHSSFQ
jgi:hypothetical protein